MTDLFRIGKISKIHYEDGMVDVVYSDRTDAVATKVRLLLSEYAMPKEKDPVLVLHLPNGRTEALCLGRYWYADWKPQEGFKGLWRKCFSRDQTRCYARYDDPDEDDGNGNKGEFLLHNEDDTRAEAKNIVIEANTAAELKAGTTLTLKGEGKVLIESAVVEVSGDSAVNITGGRVDIRGDSGNVRIGVIGFLNHGHNCTAPGAPSGPPISLA